MGWGLRILWVLLKNSIFRGRVTKKVIYKGDCLKGGAWTVHRFERGLGEKEEG